MPFRNKTEEREYWNKALSSVRNRGIGTAGPTRDKSLADVSEIAEAMHARQREDSKVTRREIADMVRRAKTAFERGWLMTTDPERRELTKNIPENYSIDRRRGRYEYVVIVRMEGAGEVVERKHVIYSSERLSGEEAIERAEAAVVSSTNFQETTDKKRKRLGIDPMVQSFIVSVSQNTPE
jgi:hypothetical protein